MHKYQPRILVVKCADLDKINYAASYASYVFPSTQFIAVTAYQNSRVTKLKIAHNPFAKGFRERQSNTRKRALEAVAHFEQHQQRQQQQPERKRQALVASPSPPPPPQVDLNMIYTESPSSGSTSTNSSFSSGSNDQPNYQLQTDFYQLPIQPIMYDPAEVYVYETHQHNQQHLHPAPTEYYEAPSTKQEPLDSLQYPYPAFPIYE